MKSLKIWSLIVLFAMALVGCGGKDDGSTLVGQWHLTYYNDSEPEFDVYVEFKEGGKFNIYQQVWSFTYEHFTGTYSVKNGVVSGKYSDGSAWLTSYQFSVDDWLLKMYNTANTEEVSVYTSCKIPSDVISEATTTRSEGVVPFL